jgi:hypothetical protein
MLNIFHYFYFLLSDQDVIDDARKRLQKFCKVTEDDQAEARQNISFDLNILGHAGAFNFMISTDSISDGMSRIEKCRAELGDLIDHLIGECTVAVHEKAGMEDPFPLPPLSTSFAGKDLFVYPAAEDSYRRYYSLVDETYVKKLIPVDCLLFQTQRQMSYYEGQLEAFIKKKEALDRKSSEVFYKKKSARDLDSLENDINGLSEIYGLMASYRFLLRDAVTSLEGDVRELEILTDGLINNNDPFFQERHIMKLRQFLDRLMEKQRDFNLSLEEAKNAIDVLKIRVELARSRASLIMQEESLTLAVAASLVEFILVLYYGLQIWKTLSGNVFYEIPVYLSAGLVVVFSLVAVVSTHRGAKAIKGGKTRDLIFWGFLLLGLVAIGVAMSLFYAH